MASVLADMLAHVGIGSAEQLYQAIAMSAWPFCLGLAIALVSPFPSTIDPVRAATRARRSLCAKCP